MVAVELILPTVVPWLRLHQSRSPGEGEVEGAPLQLGGHKEVWEVAYLARLGGEGQGVESGSSETQEEERLLTHQTRDDSSERRVVGLAVMTVLVVVAAGEVVARAPDVVPVVAAAE